MVDDRSRARSDSIVVWIQFTDKIAATENTTLTKRALARRRASGFVTEQSTEAPINQRYIDELIARGAVLRQTYKWENRASFALSPQRFHEIRDLPFIHEIVLVAALRSSSTLKKQHTFSYTSYGALVDELLQLNVPHAHAYLKMVKPGFIPGQGVCVALLDNGFNLTHRCFSHLRERKAILASFDFVDNDTVVAANDSHGSSVLSVLAAYDPPHYCGTAWGADLLLAKTENDDVESHSEEDSWAAAVVWAEEHGASIISCSLGYRDFDYGDTVIIRRPDSTFDTITSYSKSDLDGKTTIISRAARGAVDRGVIVVNAVGNEQQEWGDTSLSAPADVDGVVAVGGVNERNILTSFSSLGPSADGRIKPDLVAPGHVNVPDLSIFTGTDYSSVVTGTSLATPFISGIFALVKQSHPSLTSPELRQQVYRFCRLLPLQKTIDNSYGRGIPDAGRSCMRFANEVVLCATDTSGTPFNSIIVTSDNGLFSTEFTANGFASFDSLPSSITELNVGRNGSTRKMKADLRPMIIEVAPCSLVITVRDSIDRLIPDVAVRFSAGSYSGSTRTNAKGVAVIADYLPVSVQYSCSKAGYKNSPSIDTVLSEGKIILSTVLYEIRSSYLIYPTVLRRSRGDLLTINFSPIQNELDNGSDATAIIRSIDGSLIWRKTITTASSQMAFTWDARTRNGRKIAPGTYFITMKSEKTHHRQKFIIAE